MIGRTIIAIALLQLQICAFSADTGSSWTERIGKGSGFFRRLTQTGGGTRSQLLQANTPPASSSAGGRALGQESFTYYGPFGGVLTESFNRIPGDGFSKIVTYKGPFGGFYSKTFGYGAAAASTQSPAAANKGANTPSGGSTGQKQGNAPTGSASPAGSASGRRLSEHVTEGSEQLRSLQQLRPAATRTQPITSTIASGAGSAVGRKLRQVQKSVTFTGPLGGFFSWTCSFGRGTAPAPAPAKPAAKPAKPAKVPPAAAPAGTEVVQIINIGDP